MSAKDKDKGKHHKFLRRLFKSILIIGFIILIIVLPIWAIIQPHKPIFTLQDATIFNFNISSPNTLSSTIQVTISSRNPNDHIGIYYLKSDVYATYRSQQITYFTAIPAVYQGHKDGNVWSPFIYGNNVPVAPFYGVALEQDKANGAVWLMIKMDGNVKWRVGSLTTGGYHLHVRCPAYIPFGNQNAGIAVGKGVKYQLSQDCSVSF